MRNGIFSFYIRADETSIKAIALVENDSIRGFNQSHIYSIERLVKDTVERSRKHRNTNWRVQAVEYGQDRGLSTRGFPANLEGEEGEEQFWFEGESDEDHKVKVEIQGAFLHDLPWHRGAQQHARQK